MCHSYFWTHDVYSAVKTFILWNSNPYLRIHYSLQFNPVQSSPVHMLPFSVSVSFSLRLDVRSSFFFLLSIFQQICLPFFFNYYITATYLDHYIFLVLTSCSIEHRKCQNFSIFLDYCYSRCHMSALKPINLFLISHNS